jgi:hypothetical protein
MTSDRQCLTLFVGWLSAVCLWLIFSPGIVWIIGKIAGDFA